MSNGLLSKCFLILAKKNGAHFESLFFTLNVVGHGVKWAPPPPGLVMDKELHKSGGKFSSFGVLIPRSGRWQVAGGRWQTAC